MKVVNILKDGSVVEDMSTITIPEEIKKAIKELKEKNNEKKEKKQIS